MQKTNRKNIKKRWLVKNMMLLPILKIINLILLIIVAVLLFINRKAEKQTIPRVLFLILLVLFIMGIIIP